MRIKSAVSGTSPGSGGEAIEFYARDSAYRGKQNSVGYLVTLAHRTLVKNLEARLQPFDLTANQWAPLLAIAHGQCDTVAGCARETGIDAGAMTRMLDRLEAKGLLRRQRSDDDRRVVNIALTHEGKKIAREIPPVISNVLNHHLQGFSQHEFELIKDLVQRFLANGEMPAE
jgi:DNA-binding MarR family transcriptional regulator